MSVPELKDVQLMLLGEVKPALAPDGPEWTAHIKVDGYRLLAGISGGKTQLRTRGRTGRPADATPWYPELRSLSKMPSGTIVDGEVAVLNEMGISDFERLHTRSLRRGRPPGSDVVTFCAFDVLFLAGEDVRGRPLSWRLSALAELMAETKPDFALFQQDIPGKVRWLYEKAVALQLEGVVAKRLSSPYQGGRSNDWLKVKRPVGQPGEEKPRGFRRSAPRRVFDAGS